MRVKRTKREIHSLRGIYCFNNLKAISIGHFLPRFKFSMKLSDVWDKECTAKVELMQSYIDDYSLAVQLFKLKTQSDLSNQSDAQNSFQTLLKKLTSFFIGQVVTYVVTNITESNIEVKISLTGAKNELTVPGLAVKYAEFEELNVAQMGNAIICDFDFDRRTLLVFIQPQPAKVVKQVKNAQKITGVKNIKIDQSIKGTVIYIGQRYVLTSLGGHVPGTIAYIPSRRHRNDFGQIEKLFTLGQDYHFLIKCIDQNDRIIAVLNTDAKKNDKSKSQAKSDKIKSQNESKNSDSKLPSKQGIGPVSLLRKDDPRFVSSRLWLS